MKMIFVKQSAGLANRIKAIVSALRLSDKTGDKVCIVWSPNDACREQMKVLFTIENVEFSSGVILTKGDRYFDGWRLIMTQEDLLQLPKNFTSKSNMFASPTNHRDIDLAYECIPKNIQETFLRAFKKININPVLIKIAFEYAEQYFDDDTLSVQMRTWNGCEDVHKWRQDHFSIEKFITEISKHSHSRIFVSIDDRSLLDSFKIPDKTIIYREHDSNLSQIQNDFIDMLLLGKNNLMIVSNLSTFGEVAWWLADCLPKVIVL